ncbi:unnamed protein product [Pleuronectes platessa]|uniref:Uncharacterized protein n=1 Tax=Pleuronectes platessa TaxID=8262 RepID=A0A9N7VND2_PLEPL|nr:unnamed protein product [Pleuronectes platessa]
MSRKLGECADREEGAAGNLEQSQGHRVTGYYASRPINAGSTPRHNCVRPAESPRKTQSKTSVERQCFLKTCILNKTFVDNQPLLYAGIVTGQVSQHRVSVPGCTGVTITERSCKRIRDSAACTEENFPVNPVNIVQALQ